MIHFDFFFPDSDDSVKDPNYEVHSSKRVKCSSGSDEESDGAINCTNITVASLEMIPQICNTATDFLNVRYVNSNQRMPTMLNC